MQIKTLRFHLTAVRIAIIKQNKTKTNKQKAPKCWQAYQKKKNPVGGNVN
jgi:hypothetical protein